MKKTFEIRVFGKVQGVFYRQSTCDTARKLGISGWVRNEKDGSVFILASGTQEQLAALVSWCKCGPSKATVERVVVEAVEPADTIGFSISF